MAVIQPRQDYRSSAETRLFISEPARCDCYFRICSVVSDSTVILKSYNVVATDDDDDGGGGSGGGGGRSMCTDQPCDLMCRKIAGRHHVKNRRGLSNGKRKRRSGRFPPFTAYVSVSVFVSCTSLFISGDRSRATHIRPICRRIVERLIKNMCIIHKYMCSEYGRRRFGRFAKLTISGKIRFSLICVVVEY